MFPNGRWQHGRVVPHDSASKESRRKMAEAYSLNQKLNGKVSEEDLKKLRRKLEEDSEDTKQTGTTITDQMDLLCEQVKMLAGEVALCTSSLKRLSEQATSNPGDSQMMEQMQKLKDEIREKKRQIRVLEQRMIGSVETTTHASNSIEVSQWQPQPATPIKDSKAVTQSAIPRR
ncbi:kinesin-like protein kin-7c [Quercus suber]|uniref:Kinesin-like protein kin-7c n=1 Tax=Quercus suber TaxID=58331 RepID=A0AAW0KBJ2_QUESU